MTKAFQGSAFQNRAFQVVPGTQAGFFSPLPMFAASAGVLAGFISPLLPFAVGAIVDRGGARISAGYWSKGKWHELKKEVQRERSAKLKRRVEQQKAAAKEAALTELQRAERDLALAEKECDACAAALTANYTKQNYARFIEADSKLTELRGVLESLRTKELIERATTAKARARAEAVAVRQAKQDADAQRARQQAVIDAMAEAAGMRHLSDALHRQQIAEIGARAHAHAITTQAALDDDEEAALLLLLSH